MRIVVRADGNEAASAGGKAEAFALLKFKLMEPEGRSAERTTPRGPCHSVALDEAAGVGNSPFSSAPLAAISAARSALDGMTTDLHSGF